MLHHIVEYAKNHVQDSEPGFTKRPIHWLLHISPQGSYINIEPYGERQRGKQREERCPDMPNMRAGKGAKRAHFLVENALASALYIKDKNNNFTVQNDDKTLRRNAFFRKLLHQAAESFPDTLGPAANFFNSETQLERLRAALAGNGATENDWIMFQVGAINPLKDERVLDWWRSWLTRDTPQKSVRAAGKKVKDQFIDIITGDLTDPKDRHPPVKGLEDVGGNKSGTPLVCFDKQAFSSYGLKEGNNAPMSPTNAQLYADGLTHLLKGSHRIAGARIAYWYRDAVPREDDPLAILAGLYTEEQKAAGALASARELLTSIESGKKPSLINNHYFAMTLSGAAGRAMVRDWMDGDFKALVANVNDWFSDLEVVATHGKRSAPGQKFETIVTSLLMEKKNSQKYEDWIKPIGSVRRQLLHAAIQHQRIPPLVIERLAALIPAFLISDEVQKALFPNRDQPESNSSGLTVSRLYARMGLIKAYFIRLNLGGNPTMTACLNPDHPEPAYHCGRLLAVLAALQREALGEVGANVVQRFYSGFSQTPGLILGRIMSNAKNHLASVGKSKTWLVPKYEEHISEVMCHLGDTPPRTLDLEGQGLFALGYYQQLAELRASKKTSSTESTTENGENQ